MSDVLRGKCCPHCGGDDTVMTGLVIDDVSWQDWWCWDCYRDFSVIDGVPRSIADAVRANGYSVEEE